MKPLSIVIRHLYHFECKGENTHTFRKVHTFFLQATHISKQFLCQTGRSLSGNNIAFRWSFVIYIALNARVCSKTRKRMWLLEIYGTSFKCLQAKKCKQLQPSKETTAHGEAMQSMSVGSARCHSPPPCPWQKIRRTAIQYGSNSLGMVW